MKTIVILHADSGKVLTDGKVYGKQINLAEGMTGDSFYEITEAEYEEHLAEEKARMEKEAEGV